MRSVARALPAIVLLAAIAVLLVGAALVERDWNGTTTDTGTTTTEPRSIP